MPIKAGLNLKVLSGTEGNSTVVTFQNTTPVSCDSAILAFNYVLAQGKTDTGFTIKISTLLNPASFTASDQFQVTDEVWAGSSCTVQPYVRTISNTGTSGEFFVKVNLPLPMKYVLVTIAWTGGNYSTLSTLTVNFMPNSAEPYDLPF